MIGITEFYLLISLLQRSNVCLNIKHLHMEENFVRSVINDLRS